jgi:tetratricopeptide (TPR) repeat protein
MKSLAWLALAALAVLPYVRAVGSPMLYDDRTMLDNRWLVVEASPMSVFAHDYWYGTKHAGSDLYRPLTVLSLAWNMRAAPSKEGIRAVNVALHAAAALALWLMLSGILSRDAAWLSAALFAVHPLGSEAVLWAVGRAEILAAIFGMLAFVTFVRLPVSDGYGGARLAASASAFFVALSFKESAVAWLLIGAAWLLLSGNDRRPPMKVLAARAAVYAAALAAYLALRVSAVGWERHEVPFIDNPLFAADAATRAANGVLLFARYVGKMLLPASLSVEYGFDQIPVASLFPWAAVLGTLVAGGVIGAIAILARRGHMRAAFFAAFVPLAFSVTANVVFPIGTIFAERLAYTPLLGACALGGLAIASIRARRARIALAAVLLGACAARTFARAGDYRGLVALSEATAEASPRAVKALANAGRTRLRQGNAPGAAELLARAVALWPEYASAWRLLAEAREAMGDAAGAREAREHAGSATSNDEPL